MDALIWTRSSAEGKGMGSTRCRDRPASPRLGEQLGHSLLPAQHSIFGEGALKCTRLHPTWAGGKRDEVWLRGAA